ncbi:MAG TPA: hypothetical protein VFA13_06160 [Candidatus Acidoferrum sp.]|nr:hypothetical protein [Candidatus Acidoferrum sp.]
MVVHSQRRSLEAFLPLAAQTVSPRALEEAYRHELAGLQACRAVARLWAKDFTLWPAPELSSKSESLALNWLDLPAQMGEYMRRVQKAAALLGSGRFESVVFLAMGASNLAAHAIAQLAPIERVNRFLVLDSIDPATILRVESQIDLRRALFVVANKSGKVIELHALLLYLLDRLRALGVIKPGEQFIGVTEENSYLAEMGKSYRFREIFFDPPGITGRFSSLIHFDLLLAGVCGVEPARLEERARAMREACGPSAPEPSNPALQLAALLAATAHSPGSRLFLAAEPAMAPFLRCIGCVVGASTGKHRQGIVPLFCELGEDAELPVAGGALGIFALRGRNSAAFERARSIAAERNLPAVAIEIGDVESMGAELLKWNVAAVLACSLLGVYPFDEPDAARSRCAVQQVLERLSMRENIRLPAARVSEGGIELRAEGATRRQLSTLNLSAALGTFFDLRHADGYMAILGFLDSSVEVWSALAELRAKIEAEIGIPAQPALGPRYLHYFGQLLKGGPPRRIFLILTAAEERDIAVPGAGYSFGQLQGALALGEFEALHRQGESVIWLHFSRGFASGIRQLLETLAGTRASSRG